MIFLCLQCDINASTETRGFAGSKCGFDPKGQKYAKNQDRRVESGAHAPVKVEFLYALIEDLNAATAGTMSFEAVGTGVGIHALLNGTVNVSSLVGY